METVNENSDAVLTLTFKDENGNAVIPDSGTYRIDDKSAGTAIKASTPFTPVTSTYDVAITNTENAIIDSNREYEIKIVTVTFTYNTTKKGSGEFRYKVMNFNNLT